MESLESSGAGGVMCGEAEWDRHGVHDGQADIDKRKQGPQAESQRQP